MVWPIMMRLVRVTSLLQHQISRQDAKKNTLLTLRPLRDLRTFARNPSAEAELRLILQQAAAARAADFWAQADALRAQSGRQRYESGRLLREMRDRR
jgi:hypothetical protein